MTITKPTVGSTGWDVAVDQVIDAVNGVGSEVSDLILETMADALQGGTNIVVTPDLPGGTIDIESILGGWTAQDQGFISWTGDPAGMTNGTQPTNGVLYTQRHQVRKSATCVGPTIICTAAGTSPTNCYVGLFDGSGNLIAVTADQASNWGSDGIKSPNWASSVNLVSGTYYTAVLNGGGTSPGVLRNGNTGSGYGGPANVGLAAPFRFGSIGTGQTAIPSSITLGSVTAVSDRTYFVALRSS